MSKLINKLLVPVLAFGFSACASNYKPEPVEAKPIEQEIEVSDYVPKIKECTLGPEEQKLKNDGKPYVMPAYCPKAVVARSALTYLSRVTAESDGIGVINSYYSVDGAISEAMGYDQFRGWAQTAAGQDRMIDFSDALKLEEKVLDNK